MAQLAVALYGGLGLMFGLLRLSRAGWQGPEVGQVLTSWYVEALLFLAAWGGAACLMGLLFGSTREPRRKRRRRKRANIHADTLAALERRRGR